MRPTSQPEKLWVCDCCEATVICGDRALVGRWGWKRIEGKRGKRSWELVLCENCRRKGEP